MRQPELGKKIAECRRAKGYTQEELVEKCNLCVRTLQRIEAGEVTPRIYTVRVIFEALDLNYAHYFGFSLISKLESISKSLVSTNMRFFDLFNFKTNTFQKILILSVMIAAIVTGAFAVNAKLSNQNNDLKQLATKTITNQSEKELPFYNLSCKGYMEKSGLVIGRDISFILNGVTVKNVRLLAIDKETLEFDAQFVEGSFSEREVSIDYQKKWFADHSLGYSADKVIKTDSKIILKGNAMVYDLNNKDNPDDNESIKADEIIITLK